MFCDITFFLLSIWTGNKISLVPNKRTEPKDLRKKRSSSLIYNYLETMERVLKNHWFINIPSGDPGEYMENGKSFEPILQ